MYSEKLIHPHLSPTRCLSLYNLICSLVFFPFVFIYFLTFNFICPISLLMFPALILCTTLVPSTSATRWHISRSSAEIALMSGRTPTISPPSDTTHPITIMNRGPATGKDGFVPLGSFSVTSSPASVAFCRIHTTTQPSVLPLNHPRACQRSLRRTFVATLLPNPVRLLRLLPQLHLLRGQLLILLHQLRFPLVSFVAAPQQAQAIC